MPRLSAWAVRASLIYLLSGFTIGALTLSHKGVPYWAGVWRLLPAHIEFLIAGWMIQLAFGVAFWILPRFPGGSRGDERPAWAALILLNLGILFAAASGYAAWALLPARLLESAAALLFILHAWKRVKPLYG